MSISKNDKKSILTRSGARRLGDNYQDLIGIDILLEWLEHADRYKWVRLEADDAGSLDDVTACTKDNSLVLKQVKFSTHPEAVEDPYSWKILLYREKGTRGKLKPSLL